MKFDSKVKNAIYIGTLCSVSYLAVYFARNILSAVSPQLIETNAYGVDTQKFIGKVSSIYFIFYAVGQLINGAIGDKIKAKYMISLGLLLAGVTNFLFSRMSAYPSGATIVYGMTGFFLAMIYGPMTKIVAENTEPVYATRCSLGYTFASFFGSPLAGVVAAILAWQWVFAASSLALVVMACVCFFFFVLFEKRGIVKYNQYKPVKQKGGSFKILFKYHIVKFSLISILTGVVRTTVVFWMPTYIAQYLGFSSKVSATIFTVATLVISTTAFITVFIYEKLGHNMNKTILLMFICSTIFFLGVYFINIPVLNIILFVLAVMAADGAAAMLWSRYCPSLRDTGMVSGATGFLDFLSYMAAAVSSSVFANAVSSIGWGKLILIWAGLMALGVGVSLPSGKEFDGIIKDSTSKKTSVEETAKEETAKEEESEPVQSDEE